jgi:hypothetical protein
MSDSSIDGHRLGFAAARSRRRPAGPSRNNDAAPSSHPAASLLTEALPRLAERERAAPGHPSAIAP